MRPYVVVPVQKLFQTFEFISEPLVGVYPLFDFAVALRMVVFAEGMFNSVGFAELLEAMLRSSFLIPFISVELGAMVCNF